MNQAELYSKITARAASCRAKISVGLRVERVFSAGLFFGLLLLAGCGPDQQQGKRGNPGPPPAVLFEKVAFKDLITQSEFTGRIEAIDTVQLRARVEGFLKKRNFEEGAEVKKGQILFEIEREPYEIAVALARANLASATAARTLAQQTYDRTTELVTNNVSSKASLDTARSQLAQAQAKVQAQEAALQTALLNLSYTRIAAPMNGRVGRKAYSIGNLVGPQSNPLLMIVAQDPMYVTFPVPQRTLLEVRKAGRGPGSVTVQLRLADGSVYDQKGIISFAAVQATSSTDSVTVRAIIANPERLLIDRQLTTVRVVRKKPEKKLVISQSALVLDQRGAYVLALDDSNKVQIKRIETGELRGPLMVVTSGLSEGDRVIVSGHQKVRPGIVVTPTPAGSSGNPATVQIKK